MIISLKELVNSNKRQITIPIGGWNPSQTINASIEEFRLDRGLEMVTLSKKSLSWATRRVISFPRKILATKRLFSPTLSTWVVILSAANTSWAWTNSSMSWRPVTSGAPSQTTKSAFSPAKCPIIWSAVSFFVISPKKRNLKLTFRDF